MIDYEALAKTIFEDLDICVVADRSEWSGTDDTEIARYIILENDDGVQVRVDVQVQGSFKADELLKYASESKREQFYLKYEDKEQYDSDCKYGYDYVGERLEKNKYIEFDEVVENEVYGGNLPFFKKLINASVDNFQLIELSGVVVSVKNVSDEEPEFEYGEDFEKYDNEMILHDLFLPYSLPAGADKNLLIRHVALLAGKKLAVEMLEEYYND